MTPPLNTLTASLQPAEMSFQDQKKGHCGPAAYFYQSNDMVNAYTTAIFINFFDNPGDIGSIDTKQHKEHDQFHLFPLKHSMSVIFG